MTPSKSNPKLDVFWKATLPLFFKVGFKLVSFLKVREPS
jgi:hypothetical protein